MKQKKIKLQNRCTGACCKDIGLPYSPSDLKNMYNKFLNKNYDIVKMTPNPQDYITDKLWEDIWLIYPMLRFKHANFIHPENPDKKSSYRVYHYSCVHFDDKTGNCAIQDIKPSMCSTYPNKAWCDNPECTWKEKVEARPKEKETEAVSLIKAEDTLDKE